MNIAHSLPPSLTQARSSCVRGLRRMALSLGLCKLPVAARVHIGGTRSLAGWANVDIEARPGVDWVLDPVECLPFRGAQAIFAEGFLERLQPDRAVAFLLHCHKALAPGGWVRILTPDLGFFWQRQVDSAPAATEIRSALAWNRHLDDAGRRFLWSRPLLTETLVACGFDQIRCCTRGESELPFFRGIDHPPTLGQTPQLLILEARKAEAQPARLARLCRLAEVEYLEPLETVFARRGFLAWDESVA